MRGILNCDANIQAKSDPSFFSPEMLLIFVSQITIIYIMD